MSPRPGLVSHERRTAQHSVAGEGNSHRGTGTDSSNGRGPLGLSLWEPHWERTRVPLPLTSLGAQQVGGRGDGGRRKGGVKPFTNTKPFANTT